MYIDLDDTDGYVFYYNVTKKLNECVAQVLSDEIKLNRPMNQNGFDNAIMVARNVNKNYCSGQVVINENF